jgi:hypothetical protein
MPVVRHLAFAYGCSVQMFAFALDASLCKKKNMHTHTVEVIETKVEAALAMERRATPDFLKSISDEHEEKLAQTVQGPQCQGNLGKRDNRRLRGSAMPTPPPPPPPPPMWGLGGLAQAGGYPLLPSRTNTRTCIHAPNVHTDPRGPLLLCSTQFPGAPSRQQGVADLKKLVMPQDPTKKSAKAKSKSAAKAVDP